MAADAAHDALVAATDRLDVAGMRVALAAGADASRPKTFWQSKGESGQLSLAKCVLTVLPWNADDAEDDARRAGALRVLAEHGAPLDAVSANVALRRMMCDNCGPAALACLIDAGGDVTRKYDGGRTLLHMASSGEVARLLLRGGASPHAVDDAGRQPIHTAGRVAGLHRRGVLEALVAGGAHVDALDAEGRSPLFLTLSLDESSRDLPRAVKRLMALGADPLSGGPRPWDTPLHRALMRVWWLEWLVARRDPAAVTRIRVLRLVAGGVVWSRRRHLLLLLRARRRGDEE